MFIGRKSCRRSRTSHLLHLQAEFWLAYTESEQKAGNLVEAEAILQHCLPRVPSMKLWSFYVNYVKETRLTPALQSAKSADDDAAGRDAVIAAREEVTEAYEFCLARLGNCFGAEVLWQGLVAHLKASPGEGLYEEGIQQAALRRVYQRAVVSGHAACDRMWGEYTQWEYAVAGSDTMAAQTAVAAVEARHRNAVQVARRRAAMWGGVQQGILARPVPDGGAPSDRNARQQLVSQLSLWQEIVRFEVGNPLNLPDDEAAAALARLAFEQALLCMRCFPDLWHEYALYVSRSATVGGPDSTADIYTRALRAVPNCTALACAAADFLEASGRGSDAVGALESLLERCPSAVGFIQLERTTRRVAGIKAARAVFARARTSPVLSPAVFLASASLEAYANREPSTAARVLKLGQRRFPQDGGYAVAYLDFMQRISDDNNVRALFENVLASLPKAAAKPVWDRYVDFELRGCAGGGSVAALSRVERRRAETYPEDAARYRSPLLATLHRYNHFGALPSSSADVEFMRRHGFQPPLVHNMEGRLVPSDSTVASYLNALSAAGISGGSGAPGGLLDTAAAGAGAAAGTGRSSLPPGAPPSLNRYMTLLPPWTSSHTPSDAEVDFLVRNLLTAPMPAKPAVALAALPPATPEEQMAVAGAHAARGGHPGHPGVPHMPPHLGGAPPMRVPQHFPQPPQGGGMLPPPQGMPPRPHMGMPPQRMGMPPQHMGMPPQHMGMPPQHMGMPPRPAPGGFQLQDTAASGGHMRHAPRPRR